HGGGRSPLYGGVGGQAGVRRRAAAGRGWVCAVPRAPGERALAVVVTCGPWRVLAQFPAPLRSGGLGAVGGFRAVPRAPGKRALAAVVTCGPWRVLAQFPAPLRSGGLGAVVACGPWRGLAQFPAPLASGRWRSW